MRQWHVIIFGTVLIRLCQIIQSTESTHDDLYGDESYLINRTRHLLANKSDSGVRLINANSLQSKQCESNDTSCQQIKTDGKDQLCPDKYKFFKDMCVDCDCGDADCEIDEKGLKKECACTNMQSRYNGKCIDCDCGEVPCQLDDKGRKKCVCNKNQTLSKGRCIECDCGELSRLCYFDSKGGKQCVCLTGAAQLGGTCKACSCGENSRSCLFNKEGGLVCYCKPGYAQKNNSCYDSCKTSRDCLNGGICEKGDGDVSSFCKCPPGFTGGLCQVDTVCEAMNDRCDAMGAVCTRNGAMRLCECRRGQAYSWISGVCEDICDERKCNNGVCVLTGFNFRCICNQGFTGLRCNERIIKSRSDVSWTTIVLITLCVTIAAFFIGTLCLVRRNRNLQKKIRLQQTKDVCDHSNKDLKRCQTVIICQEELYT